MKKYYILSMILFLPLTPLSVVTSELETVAAGFHVHAHAHNDYEHERPLFDALANQFYSVEADIWLVDGEILVSHHAGNYEGSLKALYLEPLQKRIDQNKTIHGNNEPFYLWLDIKDGSAELRTALHELLKNYSMFTIFTDEEIKPGPVTVILTGDAESKTAYVEQFKVRRVCRDSNYYKENDPKADHRWRWYALNWSNYIDWNGQSAFNEKEREKLIAIVNGIHAKGKKVRFYATPETEAYWDLALNVGVDLINTDQLERLNRFLAEYTP